MLLAGLVGAIGSSLPTTSLNIPNLPQFSVDRPTQDPNAFCPDPHMAIQTKMKDPNTVEIDANDLVRNMPAPQVCATVTGHLTSAFLAAERAHPTSTIAVHRGDSWWTLAQALWADGNLYPFLQRGNPSLSPRLFPNTVLQVPNVEAALSDPRVIKRGDTISGLRKRLSISSDSMVRMLIKPHPRKRNLIYPFFRVADQHAAPEKPQ